MVNDKIVAPYGAWESPITPDIVAGSSLDFKEVHTDVKNLLSLSFLESI